jgi:hypothetical protein
VVYKRSSEVFSPYCKEEHEKKFENGYQLPSYQVPYQYQYQARYQVRFINLLKKMKSSLGTGTGRYYIMVVKICVFWQPKLFDKKSTGSHYMSRLDL